MNRLKTKYEDIISVENLIAADQIIRENNDYNYRVAQFDSNWYDNIYLLHLDLKHFNYTHCGYDVFYMTGPDGKRRKISVCKNYRDRIVQKAAIIVSREGMVSKLVGNTYASIPGRGSHKAIRKIKKMMHETEGDLYCLQGDIRHYFEEIDQQIMLSKLSNIFRDQRIVWLYGQMMAVVDQGIVLGAEESQWNANLHLNAIDHIILQECKPMSYYRYCDDIVLFDKSKEKLEGMMKVIEEHLSSIRLTLKASKRIYLIADKRRQKGQRGVGSGVDFLGYVFYRKHTDLRPSTKKRWKRKLHVLNRVPGISPFSHDDMTAHGSITGLLKHCNSNKLLKTWKNDYPNYFERLRRRKAAKAAAAQLRKKELATLLQQARRA